MNTKFLLSAVAALAMSSSTGFAVSVIVAPNTGIVGTPITNTIDDAIAQVNNGADTSNTIVLLSTEGPHVVPAYDTWSFNVDKSVEFLAATGQPIIRLSADGSAQHYMLTIGAGANANNQTETVTFTNIAIIPPTGLNYVNNQNDGISATAGNFVFNNCVLSNNNGSDGVASQEGAVPFVDSPAGNNVGDDWFQMNGANNVTFSHCTITGAADDAIITLGAITPAVSTVRLDKGTCMSNNGGAGIQVAGTQAAVVCDGSAGRVLIANNGFRTGGGFDRGIKYFASTSCSLTMTKTDVVGQSSAGIIDYNGIDFFDISDCRIADNNTSGDIGGANLSIVAVGNGGIVQPINMTRVTVHNAYPGSSAAPQDSLLAQENAGDPAQAYTITDSIISGADDVFDNMTNSIASAGPSPAPVLSHTAVVTAGPDAIANPGDLSGASVSADPAYMSETYTIGRSQENGAFLQPTSPTYATASSTAGPLRGGAPAPIAAVADWSFY